MQIKGKLNDGQELNYASGLMIGEYRGLKTVEDGGGDAGFRSELLRFPDADFSIVVLCNAGETEPSGLARKIADIVLNSELKPFPPGPPQPLEVEIDPRQLDAYVGDYELASGVMVKITQDGNQLISQASGQPKFPLFPSSEKSFFSKASEMRLTFDTPQPNGKALAVMVHQGGADYYAKRTQRPQLTIEQLQQYAGSFYSTEVDKSYTVLIRDGRLFVGDARSEDEMLSTRADVFEADFPFNTLAYECTNTRRCNSFVVSNGGVRRLRFQRMNLIPTAVVWIVLLGTRAIGSTSALRLLLNSPVTRNSPGSARPEVVIATSCFRSRKLN